MHKGTHFIGQPMSGQLNNLLDKDKILKNSRENGGERYVKHFDAWQLVRCQCHKDTDMGDNDCQSAADGHTEEDKMEWFTGKLGAKVKIL